MVSKNNVQVKDRYATKQVPHYGIRKLSVGVASVLLSTTLYMGVTAHADTIAEANPQPTINQPVNTKSGTSTGNATGSVQLKPTDDQSESTTTNSPVSETNVSSKPVQTVSPEQPADTTDVQPASDQLESVAANSNAPENNGSAKSAPTPLSKQPANADTPSTTTTSGVQPFVNLAVESDNNDSTPKHETVDSKWTIHYVNSADHKQELKAPTVITMQYTRTNTPQSDGTVQYGDWSYVPGSFKLTGTSVSVNGSDNPVKKDNIDENGKNYDVFSIVVTHPDITGYELHDVTTGVRLSDRLLNNESNGVIQAPTMSKDGYVEYDVAKERSVAVKFVDDQSYDSDTIDHEKQVGQAVSVTGRDGDTVNLNLTVPDKYQLADGQQLPTTYTFAKGSGNLTIHLTHKVVQREATVNVRLLLITLVRTRSDDGDDAVQDVLTQTRWKQLEDSLGNLEDLNISFAASPFVEVGTLTGHVDYDLVDKTVVSLKNDWTSLNLSGHSYKLPNGTEVVNGIRIDASDIIGKKLRDDWYLNEYRKWHSDVDPDYITRPWYGYLSVNATNNDNNWIIDEARNLGLQAGLVGDEPNALAKANGDRAATAVEMTNKPIDVGVLNIDLFRDQDGRLQAALPVPLVGVYIPYVEKTATRTIKVTTPDGKTTMVKQTATLAKQVDFGKDAHPAWTTGEWANYDVPAIPGYTASQSQIAKTVVTGTTEDQTVNITYTANPQTSTVVYQTEDGTPVHTTTVNGYTGQTVKVSNEVPVGWHVVNGTVPSEITFGPNGTPKTVVTIAHSHATVTSDAPKTTSDRLPDNPGKTYPVGVSHDDLNKTVTRTIKVTTPDGQTKTITQTSKLTRTADVDEVTGEVKYGQWTTGQWGAYDVPTVPGYTASQTSVVATPVDGNTKNQTIDISYTANSQTIHINYVDSAGKIVRTTAVTGKTGETVNLNLTVPDKYQLVDGQQLPTTYTFVANSGDVTIHLAHKVVQREATVDVQIGLFTLVDLDDEYEPGIVVTQNQWRQLDDEIKDSKDVNHLAKVAPTLGVVGTLTGHVNYDLVDNKIVSFDDDWTSLNLGGKTYQMPDGTEVVNGIIVGTSLSWGEKLREHVLKYVPDIDPDYATYPWHGYLSVNKSNIDPDYAGFRLVGNEPNALAKVTGDRAATAIEMANKPIDLSSLRDPFIGGELSDFNEQNGQLRAKAIVPVGGMYIPYVEKTATRTINVIVPDGKTTSVKQTVTLAKQVTSQENAHPDWTTGEWTSYDVPVIPGYTSSQSSVAKEAVTGATRDQTVNITYTANPQTMTVVYQTEDGTPVHTTTINGQTDQTVEVPSEVPVGWMIIKGEVPSEITFGANGHEPIEVTVSHRHVTVTPDQPQDNGTKLPDNPAKTFTGVEANDLNKTIVRTIKVTIPDGKATTTKQEAKLTRTADVDEVTGEVKYGTWSTGQWDAYEIPSVKGYTASQSNVAVTSVNENTKDQTVEISYTPNKQTTMIKYIDGKGQVVHTTTVDGVTNQTVKVASEVPAGWMIIEGKVPDEITFGVNGHEPINVTIDHQHVMVTPDQPKISTDKLPDNSTKTYPNGVGHDDLNKTVTRTIKVTTLDGQTKVATQTAKLTRAADVDEVTGKVTYGKWTIGEWSSYEVPAVPGYTPSQSEVPSSKVTDDTKDQTVTVTYTANDQTTHVTYVASDGQTVHTTTVTGQTDQTIKVPNETPAGWTVTGGQVPTEITFGPDGHNNVIVTVDHQHVTVTSDKPQTDGTKLPDNPNQRFHGVGHDDLNKTITRTIEVTTPDGQTKMVEQTAKLTRIADVDEVTGEVTYGQWTTGVWSSYTVPTVSGYTPSQAVVAEVVISADTADQTVKITYTADRHATHINYIDEHGDVVHTTTVTGHTDQTVKVPNEVPAGWTIVTGKVPSEIMFGGDGHGDVAITVDHQHVTVTSDDPKPNGTKLSDNPALIFRGVDHDDLNKTVTRTIKVTTPDGRTKTTEQTAKLTRTADVDEVTGEVMYGKWTTGEWTSYKVSTVPGYTPSQSEVPAAKVTDDTKDQTVTVTYTASEQTTHINYVDGDGKLVHTTTVTGKTDQTVKVPTEVPTGWMVTNGHVPTEITFGANGHGDVTVTVGHRHVTVTSDQPQADGTKLPDNPTQTFHGVAEADLNKSVTRTIKITTPAGKTDTITQTVKLIRTADVDEVTGQVTYGAWSTDKWDAYQVPTLHGYTASQTVVAATPVTGETSSQTVKITYTADQGTVNITYVDEAGQPVHTTIVTGTTGEIVTVPKEVPAGWRISQGEVPTTVTMTGDKIQTITVTVQHRTVTVTADQSQPDGAPLPDNPSQHFTGVAVGDLNKIITRTIVFKVPGQDAQTVTQTATLTRTATVDEVTGAVTYGDWTTAEWPAATVPTVDGYTASQAKVPAVTVGSMTDNQTVTVDYQVVEVPTTPTARPAAMTPASTSTVHGTVTSSASNEKPLATSVAQPTASAAKATELPQTGDDKVASVSMASLGLLLSSLSAYVLGRKRKGKGRKA